MQLIVILLLQTAELQQLVIPKKDKLLGNRFLDFLRTRLVLIKELLSKESSIYPDIDYKISHYVKVSTDEVFSIQNFRNDITRIKCNPKNFNRFSCGDIKDMILFYTKADKPIWNELGQKYTQKDLETLFPKIDKLSRKYITVPIHASSQTKNGKINLDFRGIKPPIGRH